jgi:NitT/TauT family transport system ATP-binding protein
VSSALTIRDVAKTYGDVNALQGCSLEIEPGEVHVIAGPSGCGKTTLLNAIAGFHPITGGEIALDGEPLPPAPGGERVVVFQHSTLFPWRTVLDNVIYGPVAQGRLTKAQARAAARERLAQAGLTEVADHYPAHLSSGLQRRAEIVRALMNEPRVLLLDEPFRGMDQLTRSVMHESLLEFHARERTTIVFITHDIEEAVFLGTRVSVMSARPGRVKATIAIDLPRPRDYRILTEPRFTALTERVMEALA